LAPLPISGRFCLIAPDAALGARTARHLPCLARLVIVNANSPMVLLPAVVDGFVVNPLWYLGLGRALLNRAGGSSTSSS
jgi:hypothetical protein